MCVYLGMKEFDGLNSLSNLIGSVNHPVHFGLDLDKHMQEEREAREIERIRIRNEELVFNVKIMLFIAIITSLLTVALEQIFK